MACRVPKVERTGTASTRSAIGLFCWLKVFRVNSGLFKGSSHHVITDRLDPQVLAHSHNISLTFLDCLLVLKPVCAYLAGACWSCGKGWALLVDVTLMVSDSDLCLRG